MPCSQKTEKTAFAVSVYIYRYRIMKKKLLTIAAILICLAIITGGTVAYFTAEDTARNVITSGGISVAVVEQQLVNGVPQPYEDPKIPVMPGESVSKIVSVQSLEQAAWVRMNYTVTVYDALEARMELTDEQIADIIHILPDGENWTMKDGWWYYNAPLAAGETSVPLFESVAFSRNMGNEYQQSTVEILVTAQAVQQANNGNTVTEAAGWPE